MPDTTKPIFKRVPGIDEYWVTQRQVHGLGAGDIARQSQTVYKLPITPSQVEKRLKKLGKWTLAELPAMAIPADLLVPPGGFATSVVSPKQKHPEGWEPHVETEGDEGTLISQPTENTTANERELIEGWQLNPDEWAIIGNIGVRRWQTFDGRYLHYFKAQLRRKTSSHVLDIEKLCEEIKKFKAPKRETVKGDRAFVVNISDTQMGKDDGDGTPGIIGRWQRAIPAVAERLHMLRKMGEPIGPLYVFGLGDLIENVSEFYPQQTFRVQLNLRDQVKVVRRLLVKSLEAWAPLAERVVVAAIAGNHGENRRDGKSFTDFADNHDVAVFEQLQEILAANPTAYGHVSFVLPNDKLDLTLDVQGTITGLTHGHQAGKGNGAAMKLMNWWKDQAHGMQPIGDAQLLLSGHYHYLSVTQTGAKTHIQAPSLDGGSEWWRNCTGQDAPPGMLTLTVGSNTGPSGWNNLLVV